MVSDENQMTLWNMDGAELNLIFTIKLESATYLKTWNLESAYWSLRDLRRELDAKLNRIKKEEIKYSDAAGNEKKGSFTEKEIVDAMLEECEKERNMFIESQQEMEDLSRYYLVLEQFYLHLSYLMKKHGLYLREGEDASEAYRRR